MTILAILWQSSFWEWFLQEGGDEDTAVSWVVTAIIVAVVSAGLMMGVKALRKTMALTVGEKGWSRGQTWLLIIVGLTPVFLLASLVWYMTRDFFNFIGVSGLFNGILLAWFLYLLFMVAGHLASPWRREL